MKEVVKLGQLLGSAEQRDAVHVALLPCRSQFTLSPGAVVELYGSGPELDGDWFVGPAIKNKLGIVDPFLTHPVGPKHRFYVMLYPNTITSLRHEWTHPLIDKAPDPAVSAKKRVESERWLRQFAEMYNTDYDKMVYEAETGGEVYFGDDDGPERARSTEFWAHIENVTNKLFTAEHKENTSFRCGC